MNVFETANLGTIKLKNRLIRAATFEGMADENGFPGKEYLNLYKKLSTKGVGGIITGCSFIARDGRMMHPGQAGIDSDEKIPSYSKVTEAVHKNGSVIIMQISHAGRQTIPQATGTGNVLGVSEKKSSYFNQRPKVLSTGHIYQIIDQFGDAARRSKEAGFDGVELHAAHGYLIHQFLLPSINNRKDELGIDPEWKIGIKFLDLVLNNIKKKCGETFPIIIKISGSDDLRQPFSKAEFIHLIRFLNAKQVTGIEISYGTMEVPLNIFRGKSVPWNFIFSYNPRYKTENTFLKILFLLFFSAILARKVKYLKPAYNLGYARLAKKYTNIPLILTGGFLSGQEIEETLKLKEVDFFSLSRALICEGDFILKLKREPYYKSRCFSCNRCAVMCDTKYSTRCFRLFKTGRSYEC